MQIWVSPVPNGFVLKVFDKEYMYYNEEDMFQGLLVHAGMAIMKDQDMDVIRQLVADLFANKEDARLKMMERLREQQVENQKLLAKIEKVQKENITLKKKLEKLSKKVNDPFGIGYEE